MSSEPNHTRPRRGVSSAITEYFNGQAIGFFYDEDGEVCATAGDVGMCMTSAKDRRAAARRIHQVIDRNPSDFEGLTAFLKLRATDGKVYDTLVLKSRAIWVAAFLMRSQKARAFRRWAAGVVDDLAKQNKILVDRDKYEALISECDESHRVATMALGSLQQVSETTSQMASLASRLLNLRKQQKRDEDGLHKAISDFPLFHEESFNIAMPQPEEA